MRSSSIALVSCVAVAACFGPRETETFWPELPPSPPRVRLGVGERSPSFGASIASVGDRDGDGVREFVLSDELALDGAGSLELRDGATLAPMWQLSGHWSSAQLGRVRNVGDLDRDGCDDFGATAREDDERFVFTVRSTRTLETLFAFTGGWVRDAIPTDVDGDGALDLVLARPGRAWIEARRGCDGVVLRRVEMEGPVARYGLAFDGREELAKLRPSAAPRERASAVCTDASASAGAEIAPGFSWERFYGERLEGEDIVSNLRGQPSSWRVPRSEDVVVSFIDRAGSARIERRSSNPPRVRWTLVVPEHVDTRSRQVMIDAAFPGDVDRDGVADLVACVCDESMPSLPCVLVAVSTASGAELWRRTFANNHYLSLCAWDDRDGNGVRELLVGHCRFTDMPGGAGRAFVIDGASGATVAEVP